MTSPSGPISAETISEVSIYSMPLSKLLVIAVVSTRSSAKPPPASSSAIHAAAIRIIRRLSEPETRTSACSWGSGAVARSEEHTSELQSLMRISYAVFCLKKKTMHILQRNIHLILSEQHQVHQPHTKDENTVIHKIRK